MRGCDASGERGAGRKRSISIGDGCTSPGRDSSRLWNEEISTYSVRGQPSRRGNAEVSATTFGWKVL